MSDYSKTTRLSYFASQNYRLLFKILRDDIQARFKVDISTTPGCRKILQDKMKSMQKQHPESNLIELNRKTILEVAPVFYQSIQDPLPQKNIKPRTDKTDSASRQREVFSRQLPEFVDLRPSQPQSQELNSQQTITAFEKASLDRKGNDKPASIDFSSDSTYEDQELSPEDMVQKIAQLQQQRDQDHLKLFPDAKYKETETPEFKEFQKQLSQFENSQSKLKDSLEQQHSERIERQQQEQNKLMSSSSEGGEINNNNIKVSFIQPQEPQTPSIITPQDSSNSNGSAMLERSQVESELLQSQTHDPNSYQQFQNQFKEQLEDGLKKRQDHIHTHEPGDHIQHTKNPTREVDYTIEISSMDRDISTHLSDLCGNIDPSNNLITPSDHSNRYRFQVHLGTTSDGWKRMPLYENNPTVPATTSQAERGERGFNNSSGWYWGETGENFSKYDGSRPSGNIIGYEMIREVAATGARIERSFKNVSKIELLQVLMPSEFIWDPTGAATEFQNDLLQYPYLLVHIEELDGVYLSTNKNITTAFGKITFEKDWSTNRGKYKNSFIRFSPSKESVKRFIPAPLASLNRLNISFLNPQGSLLEYSRDVAVIRNITFSDPTNIGGIAISNDISGNNRFLKIELGEWVNSQMFNDSRKIIIRDYQTSLDRSGGESTTPELQALESFLNREEGHRIITTSTANINQMINILYIESSGSVSRASGEWISTWSQGEVTSLTSLLEDNENSGFVFHMTHQCNLTFRITQLEDDVSELPVRTV